MPKKKKQSKPKKPNTKKQNTKKSNTKKSKRDKPSKSKSGAKKPLVGKKPGVVVQAKPTMGKTVKTQVEFEEMHALGAQARVSGVAVVACWFTDSGGTDKCVELPASVCSDRGGRAEDPPCPNC